MLYSWLEPCDALVGQKCLRFWRLGTGPAGVMEVKQQPANETEVWPECGVLVQSPNSGAQLALLYTVGSTPEERLTHGPSLFGEDGDRGGLGRVTTETCSHPIDWEADIMRGLAADERLVYASSAAEGYLHQHFPRDGPHGPVAPLNDGRFD